MAAKSPSQLSRAIPVSIDCVVRVFDHAGLRLRFKMGKSDASLLYSGKHANKFIKTLCENNSTTRMP